MASSQEMWPVAGKMTTGTTRPTHLIHVTHRPHAHPCASQTSHPHASMHTSHTHHPHASVTPDTWGQGIRSQREPHSPSQDITAPTSAPALGCVLCQGQDLISFPGGLPLQTQEVSLGEREGLVQDHRARLGLSCRFLKAGDGYWPYKISSLVCSTPWGRLQ